MGQGLIPGHYPTLSFQFNNKKKLRTDVAHRDQLDLYVFAVSTITAKVITFLNWCVSKSLFLLEDKTLTYSTYVQLAVKDASSVRNSCTSGMAMEQL